ncbi:hypothetical protein [Actinomadura miaoliensis]|uniref:DUF4376 domain-containing protein n=1 Tax=Actinomadura miaoliensis TaxID=430685 RepID=A0ABP7WTL1_9ACTN
MNFDGIVNVSVRLSWQFVGDITLDHEGNLNFPPTGHLADRGHVYRLTGRRSIKLQGSHDQQSRWWLYIGQTRNIQTRMNKYRNPGPGQATNLRVNNALRRELEQRTQVALFIARDIEIKIGSQWTGIDTDSTVQRTLAESAALTHYYKTENLLDVDSLNKGLDDSVDREFKDIPWP